MNIKDLTDDSSIARLRQQTEKFDEFRRSVAISSPLPSYYFGTRLVGATAYPLSWYQHHYSPLGVASVYRSNTRFDQFLNDGHSTGSALGDSIHAPRFHGGSHRIGHHANSPGHYGGNHHSLSGSH